MSWPDARRLRWTPTMRVPSDDGTEIAVEILGDGHAGPTVVFTHGWTLSSRTWHYQRALAERHRIVLMDHRDHGESGNGPRENRTISQVGRDLYAVIEATCADRDVVLVGHSMGGMTIMSLAGQHPELFGPRVKAVALVDTSSARNRDDTFGLRGPLAKVFIRNWSTQLALMSSDPDKAERLRRSGSRISLAVSRFLNLGVKPDKRIVAFVEAMTAQTAAQVVGDFWLTLDELDQRESLSALGKVSTLVIVGDRDRLTTPAHARAIAAAIPGARLLELRGAGHCAMLEQPEEVNAALLDLVAAAGTTPSAYPVSTQRRRQKVSS